MLGVAMRAKRQPKTEKPSFLDVVVPLKPREVFPEKFGAI